jgi:hypothetical protein
LPGIDPNGDNILGIGLMLNYLTESGTREATGLNITHVFFE